MTEFREVPRGELQLGVDVKQPDPGRAGLGLAIACWFGLVTGFGEVLILGIEKLAFDRFVFLSPHAIWMTPLTDLALFAGLGMLFYVGAHLWPRSWSVRIVVTASAFPCLLALLLFVPGLSRPAALLLAAGAAVQTGWLVLRRQRGFETLVRRTSVWLLFMVAALTVGACGWDWLAARETMAALPPSGANAPNVLLIVLDTVRARSLSLSGHTRPTSPQLQRWAETGTQFDWAFATAPWTTPSHASMFTGRFPHELAVAGSRPGHQVYPVLDESFPTLAGVLSASGYATAGFVANIEYAGYETGLHRGFARYEDYRVTPEEFPYTTALGRSLVKNLMWRRLVGYRDILGRKTASDVNAAFLDWLSGRQGRPFFAFLNYFDAHEPYLPPAPFDRLFDQREARDKSLIVPWGVHQAKRHNKSDMSAEERQGELDAYEGAIAYIDHHLGLLLDTLHRQGVLDNTLLIITSDHGEQFGEHKLFDHGNSLYLPLLHVPLVMRFPGRVPADVRIAASVSLRDLAATVLDLVGLAPRLPGQSLADWWRGAFERSNGQPAVLAEVEASANGYPWYPVANGDMTSLVLDREHYIRNGDGREELYNFEADPMEQHDLSVLPQGQEALGRFRALLGALRTADRGRGGQ